MGLSYSKNHKNCGVCDFWNGHREIDIFGRQVKVDSSVAKGKCLAQGAPYQGQDRHAYSTCTKWEKWGCIK